MKTLALVSLVLLGCASSQPNPEEGRTESTATSAAPEGTEAAPPTSAAPTSAAPTTAPTAEPAPTMSASARAPGVNRCEEAKGKCTPMQAAIACKRMEKGPEWGCAANQFCCIH